MARSALAAALALALAVAAAGSEPCVTPDACFAQLAAKQREIGTLRASFHQIKHVALLREPLVSTGRLLYRRPGRVRWEVVEPEVLRIDVDGGRLRAGSPERMEAVDAGAASSLFRDLGGLLTATDEFAGARFAIARGSAGPASFVLTPRDPATARLLEAVELEIDPEAGVPRRAVLREPGGDRTEIELRDVVRDQPLGEDLLP